MRRARPTLALVDRTALLGFAALDLLLVLTPGADWAYAIRAGLQRHRLAAAVSGLAAGYVLHAALAAAGLGALLARDERALTAITLAGAVVLVWLGAGALRARPRVDAPAEALDAGPFAVALRGALISGLNPKGLLLFLSVLPQFVRPQAALPVPAQLLVLGALHVLACAVVYTAVGLGARRVLAGRPRAVRAVSTASGVVLLALGAGIVVEQALPG